MRQPVKRREGKKNRAYGRNKVKCTRYRMGHKHEKSHIRRIEKHIRKYKDGTQQTKDALARYKEGRRD